MISSTSWQQYVRASCFTTASFAEQLANFAQISAVACSALITVGTYYGLGRSMHSIDDPGDLSKAIKYTVIPSALFLLSTTFGKLSALMFLVRLMGMATQRWHLIVLWVACSIMVVSNVLGIIITVGFCYPAARQWDPSLKGWCMSPQLQYETDFPLFRSPSPQFHVVVG